MASEADIRDFLVNNLSLIESGLEFKDKEFSLENDLGAGGRIDILAKDQFGIFVIIEIKKSDKTARQALHELQKYIALFRTNHGLNAEKCRCILVSTEWHELLVPFSEFSRSVDYQVDGYKLIIDESGIPVSKETINLAPKGEERYLFPSHNILFFEQASRRKAALEVLEKSLSDLNVKNYYILSIDYEGFSENVIFPLSLWLILYMLNSEEKKNIRRVLNITQDEEEIDDEEFSIESTLEEEVFCEVNSKLLGLCDDIEGGNSEYLLTAFSAGWAIEKIYRSTKSVLSLPMTDEEILRELTSFDAGNSSIYMSIITPRIKASWEANCSKLKYFLQHNEFWNAGSEVFLEKIKNISKKATVSIRVYDYCGILFGLYNFCCRGVSYLPTLEIIAQLPEDNRAFILSGFLEWDGKTFPTVESVFGEEHPSSVFLEEQTLYKKELDCNFWTMYKHGISYSLVEIEIEKDKKSIKRLSWDDEDNIVTLSTDRQKASSLPKFFEANHQYLMSLCDFGGSYFAFLE